MVLPSENRAQHVTSNMTVAERVRCYFASMLHIILEMLM
jgi:hypothetical protein